MNKFFYKSEIKKGEKKERRTKI